jgi:hypothetical protein
VSAQVKDLPQQAAGRRGRRGQALVEFALAAPVVLLLVFGLLGAARVTGATLGVIAAAREAARVAVRAPDADTAWQWGTQRGSDVGAEYGLTNGTLLVDVDTSSFGVWGEVRVAATYSVSLVDVPLVRWTQVQIPLRRAHAEVVDPYRTLQ